MAEQIMGRGAWGTDPMYCTAPSSSRTAYTPAESGAESPRSSTFWHSSRVLTSPLLVDRITTVGALPTMGSGASRRPRPAGSNDCSTGERPRLLLQRGNFLRYTGPVEVQLLWHDGLCFMAVHLGTLCTLLDRPLAASCGTPRAWLRVRVPACNGFNGQHILPVVGSQ